MAIIYIAKKMKRKKSLKCLMELLYLSCVFQLKRNHYREDSGEKCEIDELTKAFEVAERSSPGISRLFVRQLIVRLLPSAEATSLMATLLRYLFCLIL